MTLLSTKPRAKRRGESRTSSGIAPVNKRQNPVEVNTSKIGWQFPAPTSTTGIRRDDGDGSGKSRTPPSLYLIIVSRATRLAHMAYRLTFRYISLLALLTCYSSLPSCASSSPPHLLLSSEDGFSVVGSVSRSNKPSTEARSPRGAGNSSTSVWIR